MYISDIEVLPVAKQAEQVENQMALTGKTPIQVQSFIQYPSELGLVVASKLSVNDLYARAPKLLPLFPSNEEITRFTQAIREYVLPRWYKPDTHLDGRVQSRLGNFLCEDGRMILGTTVVVFDTGLQVSYNVQPTHVRYNQMDGLGSIPAQSIHSKYTNNSGSITVLPLPKKKLSYEVCSFIRNATQILESIVR